MRSFFKLFGELSLYSFLSFFLSFHQVLRLCATLCVETGTGNKIGVIWISANISKHSLQFDNAVKILSSLYNISDSEIKTHCLHTSIFIVLFATS